MAFWLSETAAAHDKRSCRTHVEDGAVDHPFLLLHLGAYHVHIRRREPWVRGTHRHRQERRQALDVDVCAQASEQPWHEAHGLLAALVVVDVGVGLVAAHEVEDLAALATDVAVQIPDTPNKRVSG